MRSASTVPDWITTGAAVAAVVGALVTIVQSRRISRTTLTYEWIARFHDPEFHKVMATSSLFLNCHDRPPAVAHWQWERMDRPERETRQLEEWDRLRKSAKETDRTKVLSIAALPNLLEEIAGMYNLNLLDRAVVKTHVEGVADSVWGERSSWWFKELRCEANSNVYQDLAKMIPDLKLRKRPPWHRPRDGRIKRGLSS